MNLDRLTELSKEIGLWAEQNFKVHSPPMGTLEEVGEAAICIAAASGKVSHCVLKALQGIRGFDNPEHFKTEFLDALCDLCVYTLHDLSLKEVSLEYASPDYPVNDEEYLANLADLASTALRGRHRDKWGQQVHSAILRCADNFAIFKGFDLWPALEETWVKVKARDWKTNPKDADKIKPSGVETAAASPG